MPNIEQTTFIHPALERNALGIYDAGYGTEMTRTHAEQSLYLFLGSGALAEQIEGGDVTFGMIRPNVGRDANTLGVSDFAAAEIIESNILNLDTISRFSFTFDKPGISQFYAGTPSERMKANGVWDDFSRLMTSGPCTGLLLRGADACKTLREQLGHWDVDNNRTPGTIREIATSNRNNLIHASDTPKDVLDQLNIVVGAISRRSLKPTGSL